MAIGPVKVILRAGITGGTERGTVRPNPRRWYMGVYPKIGVFPPKFAGNLQGHRSEVTNFDFVDSKVKVLHMGLSKNRGVSPQKWMVKIMENPVRNGMIWGENPLFSETPIWYQDLGPEKKKNV